ncbi:MAG: hypothetical protein MI741_08590, partial [Rhodospirillales bacterium]|nr:hypothetical protein [Rhodospirillales bacterium]
MSFANTIMPLIPAMYFRLGEESDDAADEMKNASGAVGAGVSRGTDGLVPWDDNKAMTFANTANSRIDLSGTLPGIARGMTVL